MRSHLDVLITLKLEHDSFNQSVESWRDDIGDKPLFL